MPGIYVLAFKKDGTVFVENGGDSSEKCFVFGFLSLMFESSLQLTFNREMLNKMSSQK